jgi:integrase/recombinase XerC/integrase/recombinase XerD
MRFLNIVRILALQGLYTGGENMNQVKVIESNPLQVQSDLQNLIEDFISSLDIAMASKVTYRRAINQFTYWLSSLGIANPERKTILEYKNHLKEKELSPYTGTFYLVAVRKFFQYLEVNKLYPDITKGIKGFKRPKNYSKDGLAISQVKDLLASIDTSILKGKRDYAMINLMIRTGLRDIEVSRADIGDMRTEQGAMVLWIHGKGRESKDEFVILTPETEKPIREYLKARGSSQDNEPLFPSTSNRQKGQRMTTRSISRIVKECLKSIGINNKRITSHSLRHTFGITALANGASVVQVKEAMRHRSIETTMVYVRTMDRVANGAEKYISF